jgi:cell filamentation protein
VKFWTVLTPIIYGHCSKTRSTLQAGLPLLDFSGFENERQEEYFAAIQRGLDRNYEPMTKIFTDVIARSLQVYEE